MRTVTWLLIVILLLVLIGSIALNAWAMNRVKEEPPIHREALFYSSRYLRAFTTLEDLRWYYRTLRKGDPQ